MASTRTRTIFPFTALIAIVAVVMIVAIAGITPRAALADGSNPTPNATPTLSPQGQELQALVNAGALPDLRWPDFSDYHGQAAMFYAPGGYAPAWSYGGKPTSQATVMLQYLEHADVAGLNPEDYDASRWEARLAKLAPATPRPAAADMVHFDLAMTVCAMRFLSDLSIGRVNPHQVKFGVEVGTKKYDLADFLREMVLNAQDVNATIAMVEPHYDGYARAKTALATYTKLAAQGEGSPLPAVQKGIRPGADYAGTPQLVARLRRLGDIAPDVALPAAPTRYAGAVVNAVKHFQVRCGLEPDGVLGKGTIAALNVPLRQRVRQLQFALERYRWIPPAFTQPPIIVNLPEFRLRTMRRQPAPFLTMRVVVGKAYRKQTPVFAGNLQYIIFRPYWNVPPSIQQEELVPKLRHDRDYLAGHGFEVVDGDQVVTEGTVSDEIYDQLRAGRLQIRQKPGPKNSLGLIKFIFPNAYNVYLHSTPVPELFSRARRDFSHGCIRVQAPIELAAWVLRDDPNWNADKIEAAMNGDQTIQVNLAKPVPVLILYSTAVVEPDGEVRFFDDIYRYDIALEEELARGYPYAGAGAAAVSGAVNNPARTATENPY